MTPKEVLASRLLVVLDITHPGHIGLRAFWAFRKDKFVVSHDLAVNNRITLVHTGRLAIDNTVNSVMILFLGKKSPDALWRQKICGV